MLFELGGAVLLTGCKDEVMVDTEMEFATNGAAGTLLTNRTNGTVGRGEFDIDYRLAPHINVPRPNLSEFALRAEEVEGGGEDRLGEDRGQPFEVGARQETREMRKQHGNRDNVIGDKQHQVAPVFGSDIT